jgi:hypothetical protein
MLVFAALQVLCWCVLASTHLVLRWLSFSPAAAVLACAGKHGVLQLLHWGVLASMVPAAAVLANMLLFAAAVLG